MVTIQTVVNGNIDTNNVAPAAGIKGSQLATGLAGPPGTILAYVEFTGAVTAVGGTNTEAAPIDVVSAGAFSFDGATACWVEFYVGNMATSAAMTGGISLWDGTDLGRLWDTNTAAWLAGGGTFRRKLTPSNASHTFKVRAWSATGGQNFAVQPGAGGAGVRVPGYILVTKA